MAFGGASEAARWQAYQTRARMGANLWLQILTMTIFGWISLTLCIIWHETGAFFPRLGHAYFCRWVIGGIITRAPLLNLFAPQLKMPLAGRWYPLIPLTDWLNGR